MDAVPIVPPLFRATKNTTLHELQTGDTSRATDTRGLRRLQIQKYPAYTLSASGLSSNHQEVVLAKQLSLIRSPDALKLCEICGLVTSGLPPEADIVTAGRHVSKVPVPEIILDGV